ncbi:MAG TPA: fibronectin type III domain-containing protein, partial [Longilinea sp.]|nr:fibronectin type III domain-containing protein [Longilinea sp.]
PGISYNGYPTGVAHGQPNSADVSRTLGVTADIAAQWRDGPPPNPPTNLTVTNPGSTVADLSWSAPENSYVIEYIVERRTEGGSWFHVGSTGARNLGFRTGTITCGHTYYFRVYARNGDGTSIASTEASVVACLTAPTNLSAIASTNSLSVDLSWTDNTNYETGYRIIRRYPVNLTSVHLGPVSANVTNYTDNNGLLCASTYEYIVYAFNSYSQSNNSNTSTVTTLICPSLAPTSFSGIGSAQRRIDLTWIDPSDASSNQEAGFTLERQTGGGSYVSVATLPGESESYGDTGLICGTSYTYRIQTYNAGGTSGWVTTTASTQPCGPAAPPTDISAQPLSQHNIQVTWTDADDETSYSIERSTDGVTWTVVGTISSNETSFIDSQLEANTQYFYRVRSVNSYSVEPYTYTEPASATTYTLGLYVPIIQNP